MGNMPSKTGPSLWAMLTIILCPLLACQSTATVSSPPNVLFIIVDDLNDWVGCMGHPQAITPNIDRLASRGMLFTQAHCNAPLCGPSRSSLLTGKYPASTGIYFHIKDENLTQWRDSLHPDLPFLPEYF